MQSLSDSNTLSGVASLSAVPKKKVLVLAYYFPPMGSSGVQRTLKFVKYLPEFGWQPIVLTITPTSYYAYDDSLLNELPPDIEIIRTDTNDVTKKISAISRDKAVKLPSERKRRWLSALSQLIYIPDNKKGWMPFAIAKASELIEQQGNIDLIFSTAPPYSSHLVAMELRKKYQLPTVVEFRDPWVENPAHIYWTAYHKRKHLELEEDVLRRADKVIAVNRALKELFIKKYTGKLTHKDIAIIPHGYDAEDFAGLDVGLDVSQKPKREKMRFVYSGVFRDDRSPVPFLKAVHLAMQKEPTLQNRLELVFAGLFPPDYLKAVEKLGLSELVTMKGYLSHRQSIEENLNADVLWATLGNVKNNHTITLGKLFEYLACNRTLFGLVPDGASKQFIEEANGITAAPDNIEDIAAKILRLYDLWKHNALPVPPAEMVMQHDRKILTQQLAKEFEHLLVVP
jgi:glycosyltransferase involved in cell wall biosynthesis